MNSNNNTSEIENSSNEYEIPIGENYKLHKKRKLGSGSFGEIYFGTSVKQTKDVAIKIERIKTEYPQLIYESKLYLTLQGGGDIYIKL
jgi:hypothetical protein